MQPGVAVATDPMKFNEAWVGQAEEKNILPNLKNF
jgi:hypothetical protein